MRTVATYHRIVRERQDFPDHAVLADFCHRHALDHVRRYWDYVGAGPRPGLAELLAHAPRGDFDLVVVQRADLLFRCSRERAKFIAQLDDVGVDVTFVVKTVEDADALKRPGRPPREIDVEYAARGETRRSRCGRPASSSSCTNSWAPRPRATACAHGGEHTKPRRSFAAS